MTFSIDRALADPQLLGASLGDLAPWRAWRVILKAAFALPLDDEDRALFDELAGGREPPAGRVSELWVIAGRRGGKSRMAAAVATYLGAFINHKPNLAPGERGHVLALSATRGQAKVVRDYCRGFLEESPILKQKIANCTADEIELSGRISIGTHAASHRSVRGRTLIAAIFDEASFWRDETSATPDLEVYRAVLPALATTNGMLVGISSPYRKAGLVFQKFRDCFGKDDPSILVVQAATPTLNPTIDEGVISRARAVDPEAARAEWNAEFRADIKALFDDALIDEAIDTDRPLELPPQAGLRYVAFADASAGRKDRFTFCVGHVDEDGAFVADVVRGRQPPFDPATVAAEFAALGKSYGIRRIVGDNYAGEWVSQAFRKAGVDYVRSKLTRSQLYLEALSPFARHLVRLPDVPELTRELRLLERRTSRSGRDSVDHPVNGHDDYANVVAGALYACTSDRMRPPAIYSRPMSWG